MTRADTPLGEQDRPPGPEKTQVGEPRGARLPGPLPHTVPAPAPGTGPRRRFRPRISFELISCALHGHVLVGLDAAEVRPSDTDVVRSYDGLRWHRCLRCDAWIVREAPTSPGRPYPPELADLKLPLRGRRLRDRYVLGLIVLDRFVHATFFGLLAVAVFAFAQHVERLHSVWTRMLRVLQPYSGSWIVRDVNKLLSLHRTTLELVGAAAAAYSAVLLVECVGLSLARRWAEYLTFVEVAVFVPFELYEIAVRISVFKMVTLVLNLVIVFYLLFAHRLLGVRGGAAAARAAYGEEG